MSSRLANTSQGRLRLDAFLEVAADEAGAVRAFGFDLMPGLIALTRILRAPSSSASDAGDPVDGGFGAGVDGAVRRRDLGDAGTDVDDAAAFGPEELQRFLGGQQKPQHVNVELVMEKFFRDLFERRGKA